MRGRHPDGHPPPLQELQVQVAALAERLNGLDRVVDEKFVRYKAMLDGQAEKTALALNASDKAITKAEAANERRFEGVNEFRAQLSDQAATFLNRDQYNAAHQPLADRLAEVVAERATLVRRDFLDSMLEAQERSFAAARAADQALIDQLSKDVRTLQTAAANMAGRLWALGVALTIAIVVVNVVIKLIG